MISTYAPGEAARDQSSQPLAYRQNHTGELLPGLHRHEGQPQGLQPHKEATMKAAIYARVSTEDQERDGISERRAALEKENRL